MAQYTTVLAKMLKLEIIRITTLHFFLSDKLNSIPIIIWAIVHVDALCATFDCVFITTEKHNNIVFFCRYLNLRIVINLNKIYYYLNISKIYIIEFKIEN